MPPLNCGSPRHRLTSARSVSRTDCALISWCGNQTLRPAVTLEGRIAGEKRPSSFSSMRYERCSTRLRSAISRSLSCSISRSKWYARRPDRPRCSQLQYDHSSRLTVDILCASHLCNASERISPRRGSPGVIHSRRGERHASELDSLIERGFTSSVSRAADMTKPWPRASSGSRTSKRSRESCSTTAASSTPATSPATLDYSPKTANGWADLAPSRARLPSRRSWKSRSPVQIAAIPSIS